MKTEGYTLIELIAVLFLIGLISVIAAPFWFGFLQRQQIRSAAAQLRSVLGLASSQATKDSIRYAVTVCSSPSDSEQFNGIKYSIHPYANSPVNFTTIEKVFIVKSTVRRSPARYNLQEFNHGDCYTTYLGLFPGNGYALGFLYLSLPKHKYVYRVGYNTLIGNIASCPVISIEKTQCY
ncbi:MAG: prepilin-type N-terminal cleavage/methylation domain-containing protein [Symploca sp. SIO2E6]|nr:prepilin-type N-terminal cleavage/methylation domain-containing protein [Symploca sp. SIO2E6]